MDAALKEFLSDGRYLPDILKDFHDQKDIFKALHATYAIDENKYLKDVDWAGQIYTIDMFLHFMARHGFTLQRSRSKQNFESLRERVSKMNDAQSNALLSFFKAAKQEREADTKTAATPVAEE